jgi:hypothetical protein
MGNYVWSERAHQVGVKNRALAKGILEFLRNLVVVAFLFVIAATLRNGSQTLLSLSSSAGLRS